MSTQSTNRKRLGILLCGHPPAELQEEFGLYNKHFERLLGPDAFDYEAYAVVDQQFPESVSDADAWLLTGSKHGVYENHPWIAPLEQFVRDVVSAQLPLVGICFGHQLIAQALGGTVEKFSGGWAAGTQHYTFSDETGLDAVALNAWHQDQVVALPDGARVLASSEHCQYAALAYNDRTVTMQPHPEFSKEFVAGLLAKRGNTLPADIKAYVQDTLKQPIDASGIARWLRQVLNG